MKNTHKGVLLLVKLQAETWNFTKSNTHPWVLFTFFKLYKWYQIPQSVNISFLFSLKTFENFINTLKLRCCMILIELPIVIISEMGKRQKLAVETELIS